jgi:hypothetical protein
VCLNIQSLGYALATKDNVEDAKDGRRNITAAFIVAGPVLFGVIQNRYNIEGPGPKEELNVLLYYTRFPTVTVN